ncbi:MAG: glycolate oxidase subunit GlcE, partial [Chromatiaceae bacterium]|nr:glycolate oxidase subunit GlcE [Chromatiaceae bacterium]
GPHFIDWGGALRWVQGEQPQWAVAQAAGGHATCYGERASDQVFQPLPPALLALHQRLKAALDPRGILNPGRLYPDL